MRPTAQFGASHCKWWRRFDRCSACIHSCRKSTACINSPLVVEWNTKPWQEWVDLTRAWRCMNLAINGGATMSRAALGMIFGSMKGLPHIPKLFGMNASLAPQVSARCTVPWLLVGPMMLPWLEQPVQACIATPHQTRTRSLATAPLIARVRGRCTRCANMLATWSSSKSLPTIARPIRVLPQPRNNSRMLPAQLTVPVCRNTLIHSCLVKERPCTHTERRRSQSMARPISSWI